MYYFTLSRGQFDRFDRSISYTCVGKVDAIILVISTFMRVEVDVQMSCDFGASIFQNT